MVTGGASNLSVRMRALEATETSHGSIETAELDWRDRQTKIVKGAETSGAKGDRIFYGFPNKAVYRSTGLASFVPTHPPVKLRKGLALCFPSEDSDHGIGALQGTRSSI